MKSFNVDTEWDDRRRLIEMFCAQHFDHCFTAGVGGGNPSERASLEPIERWWIFALNVLVRLHDDGRLGREPTTQSEQLGTGNAIWLVADIDQERSMLAQRFDNRARIISEQLNVL